MSYPLDKTDKIISIARKHGVRQISLFGSFVRGDEHHTSDLDILVEFEPGRSLFDLVRLERQLKEELKMDVDVVTPNSLHPLIRERVVNNFGTPGPEKLFRSLCIPLILFIFDNYRHVVH
jgi:uncharacterized protein